MDAAVAEVTSVAVDLKPIVIKFGGGINSRSRLADVADDETVLGENFDLDVKNAALRPRRPFKLIAQTPHGASATATGQSPVLGYAQLQRRDGTVNQLIQCASLVYTWNGATTFATISQLTASDSEIRGGVHHNFALATEVIITDLKKQEDVSFWDGATSTGYQILPTGLTNLKAKFCRVVRERVVLANMMENAIDLSHMMVFSKVSTATTFSVSDQPSSAIGLDDPVYLLTPNLRPINGFEQAFRNIIISTVKDRLFVLAGSSSFDFEFEEFYDGSQAEGDESMVNIGNDILIGRIGALDVLSSTVKFGDVQIDDISRWIKDNIEAAITWTNVYDQRRQRVICYPNSQNAAYILHKDILFGEPRKSPWSKWITTHSTAFNPTVVWSMVNPIDSWDTVYFGDADGNIYQFDADDESLDASSDVVTVTRRTGVISIPEAAQLFNVECWIDYTQQFDVDVTINFLFGGEQSPTEQITLNLQGSTEIGKFYNSSEVTLRGLYNSDDYYRSGYASTLRRHNFKVAGHGNVLQVETIASSAGRDWQIEEIGLRIQAS